MAETYGSTSRTRRGIDMSSRGFAMATRLSGPRTLHRNESNPFNARGTNICQVRNAGGFPHVPRDAAVETYNSLR